MPKSRTEVREDIITYEKLYTFVDAKIEGVNGSIRELTRTIESMQRDVATIQAQNKLTAGLVSMGIGIFFSIMNIVLVFIRPK
jgi:hypothetical protein